QRSADLGTPSARAPLRWRSASRLRERSNKWPALERFPFLDRILLDVENRSCHFFFRIQEHTPFAARPAFGRPAFAIPQMSKRVQTLREQPGRRLSFELDHKLLDCAAKA